MINGILNVYKEPGFTSHDVVAKMRGITGQKKIGHTGTLDPDAEGVLVLCLGRATKQYDRIAGERKTYEAVLLLGRVTDTQDASGTTLSESAVDCDEQELLAQLARFKGEQMQLPPMYSAKKVGGKKLYELARKGLEVERQPRPVFFYEIELLHFESPRAVIRVTCSKGTYIRTLCHDIGQALGCGGCMEHLLRTRVGRYTAEDAHRISEIQQAADEGRFEKLLDRGTVVTLGKFDALHRGHRKLIERVCVLAEQRGDESLVCVIGDADATNVLLTPDERARRLSRLGISRSVVLPFTEALRAMSPEDFARQILAEEWNIRAAVIGTDFRFGRDRAGTPELLRKLGEEHGFAVEILEKVKEGEREISSTYVREELSRGNMKKVNRLLGYPYTLAGKIVHGRQLGSSLGFPTINQVPDLRKALPPAGVYFSRVLVDGEEFFGVTNLGTKPTVGGERVGMETFLYGCDRDLYGQTARVQLLSFIRPEQKFATVDELKEQIGRDVIKGEKLCNTFTPTF